MLDLIQYLFGLGERFFLTEIGVEECLFHALVMGLLPLCG